ncbi:MAG: RHS repeat-associated core domain-containing protein [Acidobacteriota bacterium]
MPQQALSAARLWIALSIGVLGASTAFAESVELVSGAIRGTFGVNHDGAAVYSVPIEVPPGTGGMEPRLTLVYESGAPDGPLGVGWRLEGLEQIERCRPTLAQDGISAPIRFDAGDRFCLDGERLVAISGEYGADGTVYHTERESRIRVTSFGVCGAGPCFFELVRRDGMVLELGHSLDSRVKRADADDAVLWAVNSYRDRNLNTMRISYINEDGVAYPERIRYTENVGLATFREVVFTYRDRTSSLPHFRRATEARFGRTLTRIGTSIDAAVGAEVRSYRLAYDNLTGDAAPRLLSLTECAGGSCLPDTVFRWSQPTQDIDPYGFNTVVGFDFGFRPRFFGDVNGDGRTDYCRQMGAGPTAHLSCALAGVNGFEGELKSAAPFDFGYPDLRTLADVNGDGRADYCRSVGDSPHIFLSCALSTATGIGQYDFNSQPGIDLGRSHPHPRAFVDVNGDGRADFCRATGDPLILSCAPAEASGFASVEMTSAPTTVAFDFGYENFPRAFADVTGDGQAEYCRAVGTGPQVFLSCARFTGGGFEFYSFNSPSGFDFGAADSPRQLADANGDGRADYCRAVGPPSHRRISCALSTGGGFGPQEVSSAPGFDLGTSTESRIFTDADGDGRVDFCRWVGTPPNFYLACAAAREDGFGDKDFSAPADALTQPGYASPAPRAFLSTARGAATGYCRMLGNNPSDFVFSCTTLPAPRGTRIEQIVDGYGQRIDVTYGTMDDPWLYTPGTDAVYPQRDIRGGKRQLVQSYTRASGSPNDPGAFSYTYGYTYAGARTSVDGRGWLGFGEIVRRDHDLGVVTVTHLHRNFPLTGMTRADTLFCDPIYGKDPACSTYSLIHRTSRSYDTASSLSGVTEVRQRHVLTESFEYGAAATLVLELFDHDDFGNVVRLQRTSSVVGGESSDLFVHRQFLNDPGRNRFGFLTEEAHSRDPAGLEVLTKARRAYDPDRLNVVEQSRWDSTSDSYLVMSFAYDEFGNPVRVEEPTGRVRHLGFDPKYRTFLESQSMRAGVDSPRLETRHRFDARFGKELERIDPAGTLTLTEYDGFGRVLGVDGSHPDTGAPTPLREVSWTFAGDLALRETRTPLDWGGRWLTRRDTMDALGRTVRTTFVDLSGGQRHEEIAYSSSGQVTARSALYRDGGTPLFSTYRFDSLRRPVEAIDTAGDRTVYSHIAPAQVRAATSKGTPREQIRTIDYVLRNGGQKPGRILHENGQRVEFLYDALGQLEVVKDPVQGDLMRQSFDSLGRQTETWNRESGRVQLTYGSSGLLVGRTAQATGATRSYAYDALGRLVREVSVSDGASEAIDYGWDDAARGALGRLASIGSTKNWSYGYRYDAAGRLDRRDVQVLGRSWSIEQSLDPAGRPLWTRFPDGSRTTRGYGDAGVLRSVDFTEIDGVTRRLVEITGTLADTRPSVMTLGPLHLTMQWTTEGRQSGRSASTATGLVEQESLVRTAGRLVDGVVDGLTPAKSQTYTHDAVGQLVTAFGGYGPLDFAYSESGDLLLRGGLSYEYDAAGRAERVSGGGVAAFDGAYDDGGRLAVRQTPAGDDVLHYGARERLEEVERDGFRVAAFLYDHRGRRLYKEELGIETFYVDANYEETVHAGGTQWTRYVHAPEGGFATVSRGAAVGLGGYPADGDQFFLTDHLGSVRKAFDAGGQLSTALDYTPFGDVWSEVGPANFRRGFAGMELDRSTGLYYDRARYYDPVLGRFITPDSRLGGDRLEYPAFNRYAYAANDPTYFVDPSGHWFGSHIWHWVKHHVKAVVGAVVGAAEVALGSAIIALSDGALTSFGKAFISAGVGSLKYSATHFNNFSWTDWGVAEGTDFVLGGAFAYFDVPSVAQKLISFGVKTAEAKLLHRDSKPTWTVSSEAKQLIHGADGSVERALGHRGGAGAAGDPAVAIWRSLPESATREDSRILRFFDLDAPGFAPVAGRL